MYGEHRRECEQHAFDTGGKAKAGQRSCDWTAVAATELEGVRDMARYDRLMPEGRVP